MPCRAVFNKMSLYPIPDDSKFSNEEKQDILLWRNTL